MIQSTIETVVLLASDDIALIDSLILNCSEPGTSLNTDIDYVIEAFRNFRNVSFFKAGIARIFLGF